MNTSTWEDIDLIDINNFIDLENTDDTYSYWNHQDYRSTWKSIPDAVKSVRTPAPANTPFLSGNTGVDIDASLTSAASQEKECAEIECPRKRGRVESCSRLGYKACREKLRREKLNDKFSELCSTLEPGRPVKTDKLAILGDAIRIVNQLRSEAVEYKETNEKLLEEIKTLKAEKHELREEKLKLKADKDKMEQELKAMSVPPPGFMATHPGAYQAGMNKMAVFPGYSLVPMWQYMTPSARDTSEDHKLRPPAA